MNPLSHIYLDNVYMCVDHVYTCHWDANDVINGTNACIRLHNAENEMQYDFQSYDVSGCSIAMM